MAKKATTVTSSSGKPADVVKPRKPALSAAAAASLASASAEQLADQAGKLDAGRSALQVVVDAAAAAQVALTALPADASAEDRAAAETKLEEARQAVAAAEAELQKLTNPGEATNAEASSPQPAGATGTSAPVTLPEGATGADQPVGMPPSAPAPAAAEPGSAGGAVRPPVTNTARATTDQGGAGDLAGPASDLRARATGSLDEELSGIRTMAAAGDVAGALRQIDQQLGDIALLRDVLAEGERRYLAERRAISGHGAMTRQVLVVKAKQESRFRAGRGFGRTPVEIDLVDLSPDELTAIRSDAVLEATIEERD